MSVSERRMPWLRRHGAVKVARVSLPHNRRLAQAGPAGLVSLALLFAAACADSPTTPTSSSGLSSFTVTGSIRELLPNGTSGAAIAGARVAVVGKPGPIASVETDASGQYRIGDVG